jgi:diguanylate cyclase (GGDEF)-like protein
MNKLQKSILIVSSVLLFLVMALAAVSLAVFVPGTFREKTVITVMLAAMSPLPLLLAAILWKTMDKFSGQAEQFTIRDPLTKLYNQSTFWDFLGDEIERARRQKYAFTIMLIDLDNFKAINDRYGQEAGDACLLEFSKLLKSAIRKVDIAARFGGDNFMVILPVCDKVQADSIAKRLLDSLRERSFLQNDGTTTQITASIGMAVFPDHAKTGENLFLLADSMMHQAKASGKDRVSIPSVEVNIDRMNSGGAKSFFIMESIKKNLIVPYFQPIVSVHEKKILAYEVLTRIITPDRVIPAMEFIEEAEGMGAIGKIDFMLIDKAFSLVKRTGYRGFLFLNLSPKALLLNEFMSTVRKFMARHGVEPAQLVFEITERDTVKNPNLIKKAVLELKEQGFKLAIDDFGAGYSSFQYLRMFNVDFLKIDGEFIRHMDGNGGLEQSIVSNIAHLAGDLGIKTIAEYVETEAILRQVRSASINYAQGYYIQRPQPGMTY